MTLRSSAGPRPEAAPDGRRPRVHFTAEDGWINDPYGVSWVGDRYHLFYQALPGRVTWAPNCGWGHAESVDLVHWTEVPPALEPQAFERGCWSGSVVLDDGDQPVLFYTRITGDDWSVGSVARAVGSADLRTWTTSRDDCVIPGPPAELAVHTFRDPFVFRHGAEWVMLVGAGLADGGGVVQYRSADLRSWACDGLLCFRPNHPDDEVWTGAMWECPQLFPFGDRWVLLISVWDHDVLHYVAAATGDYDGRRFVPQSWQRLTYGACAYAMSAFLDRDGRRCTLSWLREEPQNNPTLVGRAGAHSVAAVLAGTDAGLLALSPHPDLTSSARRHDLSAALERDSRVACGSDAVELSFRPVPGLRLSIVDRGAERAVLDFTATGELQITRPGFDVGRVPVSAQSDLDLVLDADLLEVFGAAGYGAFRIRPASDPSDTAIDVSAPHPKLAVRRRLV